MVNGGLTSCGLVNAGLVSGGRVRAGVAPLTPDQIGDDILWLKSDAGTFEDEAGTTPAADDDDVIGRWEDQSGTGNHFTRQGGLTKPTLKVNIVNGKPVIRTDGASQGLSSLTQFITQSSGCIAVSGVLRGTSGSMLSISNSVGSNGSSSLHSLVFATGTDGVPSALSALRQTNTTAALDHVRGPNDLTNPETMVCILRSNGTAWAIRKNGANQSLVVVAGANDGDWGADLAVADVITIAARRQAIGLDIVSQMDFLQIAIFSRDLTADEVAGLEAYLMGDIGL